MSILNLVGLALVALVLFGAYRVYVWTREPLAQVTSRQNAERLSFVIVTMILAAMLFPFLIPTSFWIELTVWILYLGFAGLGASHVWEAYFQVRNTPPSAKTGAKSGKVN